MYGLGALADEPAPRLFDRLRLDPLAPGAAFAALVATLIILAAALIGAAIRLLPLVLDPAIGWLTLAPFAKSLFAVAFEAALLVGWPVGWALATQRLVERGEARVLASLGEPPARTVARLLPQGLLFAALLAVSSLALGRDAAAPGRVVNALLAEGKLACAGAAPDTPTTKAVPFVAATWLCAGGAAFPPRLVGRAPIGGVVFSAEGARVSDDLRRIELDRARLTTPASSSVTVRVEVEGLVLRGLAPWARASSLPPLLRALVVVLSALLTAGAASAAILRQRRRPIDGVRAAAIGAAGPVGALAMLRALELRVPETSPGRWLALFAVVPLVALLAVIASVLLVTALPEKRAADSKYK